MSNRLLKLRKPRLSAEQIVGTIKHGAMALKRLKDADALSKVEPDVDCKLCEGLGTNLDAKLSETLCECVRSQIDKIVSEK